jgi:hypothetical protein
LADALLSQWGKARRKERSFIIQDQRRAARHGLIFWATPILIKTNLIKTKGTGSLCRYPALGVDQVCLNTP